MIKSVVTDDQGRYVLPDMPTANYSVWVRGYGLADSKPVTARPTANTTNNAPALALTAVVAKDDVEAAKVYPGDYWMSMLEPPAKSAFPIGTGQDAANASMAGCTPSNRTATSAIRSETRLRVRWIMSSRRSLNSRRLRKPGTIACRPASAVIR